jgi:thiol-disulfide isomerase/thioredoxin
MLKNNLINWGLLMIMGLGGCKPSLTSGDTSNTPVADPYPWASWESCSQNTGDHPCNFTLSNQLLMDISLYDYYGGVIVLDLSTMWCGPCNSAAAEVQQVQDQYAEEITYITVLIENSTGDPPTAADITYWCDTYGITSPVLAGSRDLIDVSGTNGWPLTAWPTFFFITDEMVLHTRLQGFSSTWIDTLIQETLNQ